MPISISTEDTSLEYNITNPLNSGSNRDIKRPLITHQNDTIKIIGDTNKKSTYLEVQKQTNDNTIVLNDDFKNNTLINKNNSSLLKEEQKPNINPQSSNITVTADYNNNSFKDDVNIITKKEIINNYPITNTQHIHNIPNVTHEPNSNFLSTPPKIKSNK